MKFVKSKTRFEDKPIKNNDIIAESEHQTAKFILLSETE